MRKLAPNELKLLLFFCSAVFLAINLLGARAWVAARAEVLGGMEAERSALAEDKMWIEGASSISAPRGWMLAHPPETATSEQASTGLLQATRAAADEAGLKITEENLLPSAEAATGHAAALQAKLAGPFSGVAKFLFAMQSPTAWRSIPKLSIRSDTEPPNVVVDIEVHQYYVPATQTGP